MNKGNAQPQSEQSFQPIPANVGIVERVKQLMTSPVAVWGPIKQEPATVKSIYQNYACILAAIPAIASFIQLAFIGISIPFTEIHYKASVGEALGSSILNYGLSLAFLYLGALVVEKLAPKFDGESSQIDSLKLLAYSMTPVYLAGVFSLIPGLLWVNIIALGYALYIYAKGSEVMAKINPSERIGFVAATVIVNFILMAFLGVIARYILPVGPSF